MKDKLVAIVVKDGKCKFVADVKTIDQKELNKLKNEHEEYCQYANKKAQEHNKEHEIVFSRLHLHEVLLAKSIFDNFVDKGLLETNEQFEKDWFDYMFNDSEFKLDNAPSAFNQILRKVGNVYGK